jgi:ABC-2 type transport system permease protein
MLGLMIKDFLVLKWYLCLSFFFGVWMIALVRTQPFFTLAYFNAGWILIWFVLVRGTFAMDEHTRSEAVINSLPLSKKEIVTGRHLTSLALLALGFLDMLVWYIIIQLVVPHNITIPWISAIVVGLTTVAILTVSIFPLFFKLGYMKARWIYFLVIMFIFAGSQAFSRGDTPIPDWANTLVRLPGSLKLGLAILFFAALMQFSILVCTRLYRGREF